MDEIVMALSPNAVENEALSLPENDRLRLAAHLLDSVEEHPPADPDQVKAAWVAEADRRYKAYLRGEERAIPAEDVFSELRADDH